jgi:heme exporter protein C
MKPQLWTRGLPALALATLAFGVYEGLVAAPADRMMGDVYRIMFVHVPSAWMSLVAYTVNFGASLYYLFKNSPEADALAEASAEVGVVFNTLLLITGSIWGRPTWGVWWSWDPRLTTAAIMLFAFSGYVALRRFVEEPERRATWAAVVAIIIFADIPIVWFSVKWWNSLHQLQSSPSTVAGPMVLALRVNAFAFLFIYMWFVHMRYTLARLRQRVELSEPPEAA